MIISGIDIDEVLQKSANILHVAQTTSPRDMLVKELLNATLEIQRPECCIIRNTARKLDRKYLAAEMLWYLSGDTSIEHIKQYASMWNTIADESGNVNSNYGNIVFFEQLQNYDGSQYDWVIDSLTRDKDSRQALINYNAPRHKGSIPKDFVCTISQQFFIREDILHSIVAMRSNDCIYGFSYDAPFFSFIQQMVLRKLRKTYKHLLLGTYYHNVGSFHVYERHFDMIAKIAATKCQGSSERMLISDIEYDEIYSDIINKTTDSGFMKNLLKLKGI